MSHSKSKYLLQKLSGRRTGFPMATVIYYGPTDQSATKVVVGIFLKEGDEGDLRKWFLDVDIRNDENTTAEIVQYLQENSVVRVAMLDRIFGCPHEEGIDYPQNESCPQCPFWAGRDRFAAELV